MRVNRRDPRSQPGPSCGGRRRVRTAGLSRVNADPVVHGYLGAVAFRQSHALSPGDILEYAATSSVTRNWLNKAVMSAILRLNGDGLTLESILRQFSSHHRRTRRQAVGRGLGRRPSFPTWLGPRRVWNVLHGGMTQDEERAGEGQGEERAYALVSAPAGAGYYPAAQVIL